MNACIFATKLFSDLSRIFTLIFAWLTFSVAAQRNCLTHPVPGAIGSEFRPGGRFFEQKIADLISREDKSVLTDPDTIYYIPVVVHVLHNGEPLDSGRNISLQRIQSQIDVLNQDYGRQSGSPGFNNHPAGADTRIRFCLATQDPSGNPSNGVVRVNTGTDAFDLFTQNAQLKNYSLWDPEKYLNIWVCKLQNNYIGYAQYPYISPIWADSLPMVPNIEDVQPDGVVIEYRVFGLVPAGQSGPYGVYNKGRTATHEVGHYLGLLHIWGDGFSCADDKTDFCSDTPKQGTFTSGCPATVASCVSGVPAMKENYMDYTNDACMNIFTQEQKKRMRIVLRNCIRRKTLMQNVPVCSLTSVEPDSPAIRNPGLALAVNPQNDELMVNFFGFDLEEIEVFDLPGRPVYRYQPEKKLSKAPLILALAGWRSGTYFVRVKDDSGRRWLAPFIRF
jgi:hypothetical protein